MLIVLPEHKTVEEQTDMHQMNQWKEQNEKKEKRKEKYKQKANTHDTDSIPHHSMNL